MYLLLFFACLGLVTSCALLYLMFSSKISSYEKELIMVGSLGGPVIIPLLTIGLWVMLALEMCK